MDHVAVTCSDLRATADALDRLGIAPEYGGEHGDGTTHMSLLGFGDGTYLELISSVPGSDGEPGYWPRGIADDAGPFAWAVRAGDARTHLKRVIDAGHPVEGPTAGSRERPDGTPVEWEMGVYGDEADRAMLPFAVADLTPRGYRVPTTGSVADGPLRGVGEVLVAVGNLDGAIRTFRDLYRLPTPQRRERAGLTVASFPGAPLALVSPADERGPVGTGRSVRGRRGRTPRPGGTPGVSAGTRSLDLGDDRDGRRGSADPPYDLGSTDAGRESGSTGAGPGPDGSTHRGPTGSWVADRLSTYADRPCGVLLATDDLSAATDRYPLTDPEAWPTGRVAWFEDDAVGRWLGVVEHGPE